MKNESPNEKVTAKLLELVKLTQRENENEPLVRAVLLAILGVRESGDEVLLAEAVRDCITDKIMPNITAKNILRQMKNN